jgi:glycosyltransferase involved in cell wall biosynthesis
MPEFKGKVLLIGNYLPDRQESMQRFAQMFVDELPRRGIRCKIIRPELIFGRVSTSKWFGYFDKLVLFPMQLKKRLREFCPNDVIHICDHSNAVYVNVTQKVPHLVTCHDLLAIRSARGEFVENPTSPTGQIYQRKIFNGLKRARKIVCVSEATRNDLLKLGLRHGGREATVIYNGLNYPYSAMNRDEARKIICSILGSSAPKRFILHVGGNQWYKNRAGVVRIHEELLKRDPAAPDLIFVGKELPEEIEARPRIHSVVNADNEMLRAFYSSAEALLFPSLAEGFGWPIIEAQACGCRVATSNRPPMTEIGGAGAVYFDPTDIERATDVLQALFAESEEERRQRIVAGFENIKRFDTGRMIDQYIEVYSALTA